jgi:PhnB protein
VHDALRHTGGGSIRSADAKEHPMASRLNPYLNFRDSTRDAMTYYQEVFGGELTINTFGDFGMTDFPDEVDKVMHSQLETPAGFVLMAADVPASMELSEGSAFSVSLSGDDVEELRGYWDALSASGTIGQPLVEAPWGDSFGECTDRFGVMWLVNIAGPAA